MDCAVIGGGIVGLSVAMSLLRKQPGIHVAVLEKEAQLALHQSGRNSGVIHSGICYQPGTLKARLAVAGNRSIIGFCQEHGIPYEICGKTIVAVSESELPRLQELYQRGIENGIKVKLLSSEEVRDVEPHVRCLKGIRVLSTGIVSYSKICASLADLVRSEGGVIKTDAEVMEIQQSGRAYILETAIGEVETTFLINCGGLQSDRISRRAGIAPGVRIIPFRGEYYHLASERRDLVKGLVYPVPDPSFPFLGVHFTRLIDGSVQVGPNAVLAFRREGYRRTDFGLGAILETLSYPGFWKLVRNHYREGLREMHRSLNKKAFVRGLQQMIPEIRTEDLVPARAGVRAQALRPDGRLVDDFLIAHGPNSLHVCNAPSPAATASLEIGKAVAEQVPELRLAARHVDGNCS